MGIIFQNQCMIMRSRLIIGWRELISLPDLGVRRLHAKIDTGARSSAIHAESVLEVFQRGQMCVRFEVITDDDLGTRSVCTLPVLDRRHVMNSGGKRELRYFVNTTLCMGGRCWPIQLSLTTRHQLRYSMLIGRQALGGRVVIYPGRRYLTGEPTADLSE
jgi:hypothetical protein